LFYLTAPGVRKSVDNRAWLIDKVLALTTLNLNLYLTSEGNHMVPSLALLKRKKLKAILDVTTNVVVVIFALGTIVAAQGIDSKVLRSQAYIAACRNVL
jgi:hypothetical protein